MNIKWVPDGPYVYALKDVEGVIFYIGKGRNRRMYDHEKEALRGKIGDKFDCIRKILDAGDAIQYEILGLYKTDKEAVEAEVRFIAEHKNLFNKTKGGEIGGIPLDPKEVIRKNAKAILNRLILAGNERHPIADIIRSEIENPSPNMVSWTPTGGIVFGWHCDKPLIKKFSVEL